MSRRVRNKVVLLSSCSAEGGRSRGVGVGSFDPHGVAEADFGSRNSKGNSIAVPT